MSINRAEFANFICHFGPDKVMLDRLTEIVLPAFTDDTLIRQRGVETLSEYFFYDVHLEKLGRDGLNEIVGIYGQFIKNVNLTRTQIFNPSKGLVQDPLSMASSPSSTFLLVLNSHQLVFLPRTNKAPTIKEFESTARKFIVRKYKAFIDSAFEQRKIIGDATTKKALREETPFPEINVVPHANLDSVADFVARFEKLRSIDFQLLRPNPVIDGGDTFRQVREVLESIGANNGKVSGSNNADGLHKSKAINVIDEAAKGGNSNILLKGVDEHGATISGSNDDFKVSVPLPSVPQTRQALVTKLFSILKETFSFSSATSAAEDLEKQTKLNGLAREI